MEVSGQGFKIGASRGTDKIKEFLERVRLTDEDIPKFLPEQYIRECADEDGCMTKYKIPTDKATYFEGAQAQLNKVLNDKDLALRDRSKPVKYDLATNTNYIAVIPLREAIKEANND